MDHRPGAVRLSAEQAAPVLGGGLPLLGLLPALRRDSLAVFGQARALGAVVRLPVPRHRLFLLSAPAHIRHVLQDNAANYCRTPFHDRLKSVLGEGLVTSDGALWQQQRQLLQPAFRAERIRGFVAIMAASAASLAERWDAEAASGTATDIAEAMSDLTLDIAIRCMFGAAPAAQGAAIGAAVREAQARISARFWSVAPGWTERLPTPANRRFGRAIAALDGIVADIIRRRLAAGEAGDDLLGMLLAAQGEGSVRVDARQVRDEVMTMLLAGHETSAGTLGWAWHLLAGEEPVAQAVGAEVAQVLGGRALPEAADLGRLELTRAVLQETLRLYPAAPWFGRLAAGPDRIGGIGIPAGAILVVSPYHAQRDPAAWPEPGRFDPGRFAPGRRPAPYTWFPFGGGPRSCIGTHFAMTEMIVALAVLAPRFRLRPAGSVPVRPRLMVTLRPEGGLPMRLERRLTPA